MSNAMPESIFRKRVFLSLDGRAGTTEIVTNFSPWGVPEGKPVQVEYLRADLHTTKVASLEAKLAALVEAGDALAKTSDDLMESPGHECYDAEYIGSCYACNLREYETEALAAWRTAKAGTEGK